MEQEKRRRHRSAWRRLRSSRIHAWESRDLVVTGDYGRLETTSWEPVSRAASGMDARVLARSTRCGLRRARHGNVGGEPGKMHGTAGMIGGDLKLLHALRCCVRARRVGAACFISRGQCDLGCHPIDRGSVPHGGRQRCGEETLASPKVG